MTVITRFAPSPTGYLHIGGARTALFNYLYAKNQKGKFILRVEDTDKARSTEEAKKAILDGLNWLGLKHDELIYQSNNQQRHSEIAKILLDKGAAYYCYTPQEEIAAKREDARKEGKHYQFVSEWRDKDPKHAPQNKQPVIRIKAPKEGSIIINDLVQGKVEVECSQLDDMILLRSDGTPTYMLAVVVDDHDSNVTHIIRGDDHLNNAFRQHLIYQAMNWKMPEMVHIPLIHGIDGKKLSKRHGAVGVDFYDQQGYLPEAVFNYLLRLGWSHGNDEIISKQQAIDWFNLDSLGKSAAKLDFAKMLNLNAHYIKNSSNEALVDLIISKKEISDKQKQILSQGIEGLKTRAKTANELIELAEKIYLSHHPIKKDETALAITKNFDKDIAKKYTNGLEDISDWSESEVKELTKNFAAENGMKLGEIAQFIRAQLTGSNASPSVFEILPILGKKESMRRLTDF